MARPVYHKKLRN